MAQPTDLPTWATSATGIAGTTAPTSGQQLDGWVPGQKPPAQYFNWWQNRVGQWLSYLKNLTNEALTWSAKHTFAAGLASSVAPSAATDVVRKTELDTKAADSAVVHLAGAESVAGVKTFSSSPVVPTPVASGEAASKGYVDGKFPAPSWTNFTLNTSAWTGGTGAFAPAYWKDSFGVVHLKGYAIATVSPGGTLVPIGAGALPIGSRPLGDRVVASTSWRSGAARSVGIHMTASDGSISVDQTTAHLSGDVLYLDGVTFVAEQ